MNTDEKTAYVAEIFAKSEELLASIRGALSKESLDFILGKIQKEKDNLLFLLTGEKVLSQPKQPAVAAQSAQAVDEKYFTKKAFNPDNF